MRPVPDRVAPGRGRHAAAAVSRRELVERESWQLAAEGSLAAELLEVLLALPGRKAWRGELDAGHVVDAEPA